MSARSPSSLVFVIQLRGGAVADPTRLRGRIEHVLSGRRHDFDSGFALLSCLRHELEELCRGDEDPRDAGEQTQPASR